MQPLQLHHHYLSQCMAWMYFPRVRRFVEPPGLPSDVYPIHQKGGKDAVLHQEQTPFLHLPSFPSNYISKVHFAGKPEQITVLQADQEDGLKTGCVWGDAWRWTELGFCK